MVLRQANSYSKDICIHSYCSDCSFVNISLVFIVLFVCLLRYHCYQNKSQGSCSEIHSHCEDSNSLLFRIITIFFKAFCALECRRVRKWLHKIKLETADCLLCHSTFLFKKFNNHISSKRLSLILVLMEQRNQEKALRILLLIAVQKPQCPLLNVPYNTAWSQSRH